MRDFIAEFGIRQTLWKSDSMLFAVIGLLVSLVAIGGLAYLAIRRKDRLLLLITLLAIGTFWHVFTYTLIFTGFIRAVPDWYNKGIPFYYLIAPAAYFFVLFTLFPRIKWSRSIALHLLPFVFGLIDIIPYALASPQEKIALLEQIVYDMQLGARHPYGFIDQRWHYIGRFSIAFVYLIAQWRLIYLHDIEVWPISSTNRRNVIYFSIIYTCLILMQSGMVLSLITNVKQSSFMMQDADELTVISIFYLLFSCWILQQLLRNLLVKNGNYC